MSDVYKKIDSYFLLHASCRRCEDIMNFKSHGLQPLYCAAHGHIVNYTQTIKIMQ